MINFKEVKISEIFDIIKWKSLYTKTYINNNMWVFPVFSSQTTRYWIVWNVSTYDYSNNCITWTTDWIHAWTAFLRENCKFSMTTHCWALFLLGEFKEKIFLRYVFDYLKIYLKNYAIWTDNKRITSWMIKDVFIKIPIKENLEFDLEKQKEIAWKYEKLEKIKDRIRIMKEDLENQKVSINSWNIKNIKLLELVDIQRWKSKYTQTYVQNNVWKYNLYSAKTTENGLMWKVNFYDFDTECLTYTTNWVKAWTLFYREKHKFSLNWDSAIIIFKEFNNLDYKYFYYNLYLKFKEYGFNWENKATPKKIYEIEVDIPIKENWEFDLKKQKEIAEKYEKIEKIKNNLIQELEYLEKVKVEI